MKPWLTMRLLAVLLAFGLLGRLPPPLHAQAPPQGSPRVGFVYPAGGRPGTTFTIALGGQTLDGVTNVFVSGEGVRVAVVDYVKPMNPGQFNMLRDRLRELQEKRQAAARAARSGEAPNATNTWTAADDKTVAELRARILKNPPNRQATPALAETVTATVTIAADAEPGDRELRVATFNGLSNPRTFCVGQFPEFSLPLAQVPNPEFDRFRAQFDRTDRAPAARPAREELRVTLPAIVNGQILPGTANRFRFTAQRGQRLVVQARARSLIPYLADAVPGWFQATLALYDARGKELAYDDDYRFHPDPVLQFQIPQDGEYRLEIKDAIYRGREDFVYRIALGELPFVTGHFPLGGPADAPTQVELTGWNLPETRVTVAAHALTPGVHALATGPGEPALNRVPFAVDTLPETREAEPNGPAAPQPVSLPVIVNGRLESPGDVDVFRLEARAGEVLVAEVLARRLDSPVDSLLRVTDAAGHALASNDDFEDKGAGLDTHHADSYLRITLPTNGVYLVHLSDAQRQGGPEYAYRLRLSAPRPDFDLRLVPASLVVRPGASVPVTVYALRQDGFSGEIALALKDAPTGFSLSGARVPAGEDKVRFTVGSAGPVREEPVALTLEGRASIAGREVVRRVVPAEDMMQAFAYRHLVPAQELCVAMAGRGAARGAVRVLSPLPIRIPAGGTVRVQVGLPLNTPAGPLQLELSDPPAGIRLREVTAARQGSELVFEGEAAKLKLGAQGNLIVAAYAGRPNAPGATNRLRAAARRAPVGTLPAIPFEIVAP